MQQNSSTHKPLIITDDCGQSTSPKYGGKTVKGNPTHLKNVLRQMEDNYEEAFGEMPTAHDLKNALYFTYRFLLEIGELTKRQKADSAGEIKELVDEECPLTTASNILSYTRTDYLPRLNA